MNTLTDRLNEAFTFRGIATHSEKIAILTAATGRSARTAERWLSGSAKPRNGAALVMIARALDVDAHWLYDGKGRNPAIHHIIDKMQTLPAAAQAQFARLLDRWSKNDAEILAAVALFESGKIDGHALVAMA